MKLVDGGPRGRGGDVDAWGLSRVLRRTVRAQGASSGSTIFVLFVQQSRGGAAGTLARFSAALPRAISCQAYSLKAGYRWTAAQSNVTSNQKGASLSGMAAKRRLRPVSVDKPGVAVGLNLARFWPLGRSMGRGDAVLRWRPLGKRGNYPSELRRPARNHVSDRKEFHQQRRRRRRPSQLA